MRDPRFLKGMLYDRGQSSTYTPIPTRNNKDGTPLKDILPLTIESPCVRPPCGRAPCVRPKHRDAAVFFQSDAGSGGVCTSFTVFLSSYPIYKTS